MCYACYVYYACLCVRQYATDSVKCNVWPDRKVDSIFSVRSMRMAYTSCVIGVVRKSYATCVRHTRKTSIGMQYAYVGV